MYQSGDNDGFPLSIAKESTTNDYKPQGTAKWTLDIFPKENELYFIGKDPLEGRH